MPVTITGFTETTTNPFTNVGGSNYYTGFTDPTPDNYYYNTGNLYIFQQKGNNNLALGTISNIPTGSTVKCYLVGGGGSGGRYLNSFGGGGGTTNDLNNNTFSYSSGDISISVGNGGSLNNGANTTVSCNLINYTGGGGTYGTGSGTGDNFTDYLGNIYFYGGGGGFYGTNDSILYGGGGGGNGCNSGGNGGNGGTYLNDGGDNGAGAGGGGGGGISINGDHGGYGVGGGGALSGGLGDGLGGVGGGGVYGVGGGYGYGVGGGGGLGRGGGLNGIAGSDTGSIGGAGGGGGIGGGGGGGAACSSGSRAGGAGGNGGINGGGGGAGNSISVGGIGLIVLEIIPPVVCFLQGSKIFTDKGYKLVQDLRKGDLVKTLLHGFVPIYLIGKREMNHVASDKRIKDQLYTCSPTQYPELLEDLVITGAHSLLVDNFANEEQRSKTKDVLSRIFVTDKKYRLPACCDNRTTVYKKPGTYTIYHLALENENYYTNYGIFANGLLVESCSKCDLKRIS